MKDKGKYMDRQYYRQHGPGGAKIKIKIKCVKMKIMCRRIKIKCVKTKMKGNGQSNPALRTTTGGSCTMHHAS